LPRFFFLQFTNLQYVKNQTKEICLEAIKQDETAKIYINPKILKKINKDKTQNKKKKHNIIK
jgi:hypothetical protein